MGLTPAIISTPINVRHYGAVGDGVHDDTVAITAAIAQVTALGGTLVVPPGTYRLDSAPVVPGTVRLDATGAFYQVGTAAPVPWATATPTVLYLQRDFGASGSARTYTVDTTAGIATITVGAGHDFTVGQAVWLIHGGAAPSLSAPTGLAISLQTNGSATAPSADAAYTYYVATCDDTGGITAAAAVSTTTGYSTLYWRFWHKVSWTPVANAASYAFWVQDPSGATNFLGVTYNDFLVDFGQGLAGNSLGYAPSDQYPASPPTSPLGQTLLTTIVAVTDTTVTLQDPPQASLSGTVLGHDDTAPWTTALGALASPTSGVTQLMQEADTTCYVQGLSAANLAGVTIAGGNEWTSILKLIPGLGANVLLLTDPTDVTVENLVIDGNRINTVMLKAGDDEDDTNGLVARGTSASSPATGVTYRHVHGQHTWMSALKLGGSASTETAAACLIESCTVTNSGDQGISVWNATDVRLSDCYVTDGGWAGVSFTQSDFCTAVNVHSLYNTYFFNAPNSEGHAFAVEGGRGNRWVNCIGLHNNSWALHVGIGPYSHLRSHDNAYVGGVLGRTGKGTEGVGLGYMDGLTLEGTLIFGNAAEGVASSPTVTGVSLVGCTVAHNGSNGVDDQQLDWTVDGCTFRRNLQAGVTNYAGGSAFSQNLIVRGCRFQQNHNTAISLGSTVGFDLAGNTVSTALTLTYQETLTVQAASNGMAWGGGNASVAMVGVVLSTRPEGIGAVFVYEDNGGSPGAAIGNVVWNDLNDYEVDWPQTQGSTTYSIGQSVIVQYVSTWDPSQIPSANLINVTKTVGNNGISLGNTSSVACARGSIRGNHIQATPYQAMILVGSQLDVGGNVVAAASGDGILLESVTDSRVHDNQLLSNNGWGIQETGTATANVYEGNTFAGNTSGAIQLATGSTSVVRHNPGVNPVGLLTAPTMPASGTALANPFPYACRVYITGGTVTALAVNGTATGLTSGLLLLGPGDTVTLTYSAAPSWVWFGD